MVKLRGVNVWPEAIGELAMAVDGVAPDWFVRAVRRDGRDELIVSVVSERDPSAFPVITEALEQRLKERLGVRIAAEVVAPGALDAWTGVDVSPKLRRFRDER
jgi:phenylacetate-CoA ligase